VRANHRRERWTMAVHVNNANNSFMKKTIILVGLTALLSGCKSLKPADASDQDYKVTGTYCTVPKKLDFVTVPANTFFNAVPWNDLKKTEFENLVQYSNRISTLGVESKPVFIEIANTEHTYDAEKQQLYFGIKPDAGTADVYPVYVTSKEYDRDIQQNAFGAQAEVTHTRLDILKFKFLNLDEISIQVRPFSEDWLGKLGFLIHMSGNDAEKAIKSKSLILAARIRIKNPEDAKTDMDASPATIENPRAYLIVNYQLPVEISALALIDRSSSTVLASWSADDANRLASK
jgi:hypothetical protein